MKSLKVLACAACLMGTVSGVGFAKDVQTIAGSMVVPNNVNIVSASKTNTRDFVEKQMQQNPSKSTMANMMAKEFFQNFGTNFDIYQLQGADKTGQKDAFVVAVDVKQIAQQVAKEKANDPMFIAAMAALDKGQIDPVTEQLLLGTINKQIPTSTTVVPLNGPINVSSRDPQKASTSGGWYKISNICSKLSLVICRWKCTNSTLCKCCICVEARKTSVVCRYNN